MTLRVKRIRDFCGRLGIEVPLLSAPMTSITTPELVAAVSNAGGLGILAADLMSPEEIISAAAQTKRLTDRPFGINLRIPPRDRGSLEQAEKVAYALSDLRKELGLEEKVDFSRFSEPEFESQLEAVLETGVPVVSCTFGGFREVYGEKLHQAGVYILGAATTLREAKVQRAADSDAVILQGVEAGGPRLYFESDPEEASVGLSVLLPEAARALKLPLIASGGIGSAFSVKGAMMAGASAVMVGSALACSPEAGAPKLMRDAMIAASDTATCLTDLFSGRLERVMKNGLIEALSRAGVRSAGYPYQRYIMQDMMEAAVRAGRQDLLRMPVGQAASWSLGCWERSNSYLCQTILPQRGRNPLRDPDCASRSDRTHG